MYESVKPPSGSGKLLWHALGAKTIALIKENVHIESVRDDVETLVLDDLLAVPLFEEAGRNISLPGRAEVRVLFVCSGMKSAARACGRTTRASSAAWSRESIA